MNILEQVLGSTGIYPQATIEKDKTETKRTPWQNGWNAAFTNISERSRILTKWYETLPEEERQAIDLFEQHGLSVDVELPEKVILRFLLNDTFYFGISDSEDVTMLELLDLAQLAKDVPSHIVACFSEAFGAKKRNMDILEELRTEDYYKAKELLL